MIKKPPSVERVFVAIDANNIYHSGRDTFGPAYRINFRKLIELIQKNGICLLPRRLEITAYTVTPNFKKNKDGSLTHANAKNRGLLRYLESLGFAVKNRETFIEKGIAKPLATDWDVGITLDAVNLADSYDTYSLVSGDGDYSLLIEDLKNRGKYTEIVTFEKSASRILCAVAHRTIVITADEMFEKDFAYGRSPQKDPRKNKAYSR